LEEELRSWKLKQKQMLKADEARDQLEMLEVEEAWVGVNEVEDEIEHLQKNLQKVLKEKQDHEKYLEKLKNKQAKLQETLR